MVSTSLPSLSPFHENLVKRNKTASRGFVRYFIHGFGALLHFGAQS